MAASHPLAAVASSLAGQLCAAAAAAAISYSTVTFCRGINLVVFFFIFLCQCLMKLVHILGLPEGTKQWGGVAGYASYALDPHFTLNTRLEWYDDTANGFSNAAPVGANYYEATAGIAIKPFPKDKILSNLLFRPEIRYDHSDRSVFSTGKRDQLTFSMDALCTF